MQTEIPKYEGLSARDQEMMKIPDESSTTTHPEETEAKFEMSLNDKITSILSVDEDPETLIASVSGLKIYDRVQEGAIQIAGLYRGFQVDVTFSPEGDCRGFVDSMEISPEDAQVIYNKLTGLFKARKFATGQETDHIVLKGQYKNPQEFDRVSDVGDANILAAVEAPIQEKLTKSDRNKKNDPDKGDYYDPKERWLGNAYAQDIGESVLSSVKKHNRSGLEKEGGIKKFVNRITKALRLSKKDPSTKGFSKVETDEINKSRIKTQSYTGTTRREREMIQAGHVNKLIDKYDQTGIIDTSYNPEYVKDALEVISKRKKKS